MNNAAYTANVIISRFAVALAFVFPARDLADQRRMPIRKRREKLFIRIIPTE